MVSIHTLMAMGAPGMQEMLIILAIIILLFGAKKIPELARGLGKGISEFKSAKNDVADDTHGDDPS